MAEPRAGRIRPVPPPGEALGRQQHGNGMNADVNGGLA
jgi:hypothetical protein